MAKTTKITTAEARRRIEADFAKQMAEVQRMRSEATMREQSALTARKAAIRAVGWLSGSDDDTDSEPRVDTVPAAEVKIPATTPENDPAKADDDLALIERFRVAIRDIASTRRGTFTPSDLREAVVRVDSRFGDLSPKEWSRSFRVLCSRKWLRLVERRRGNVGSLYEFVGGHSQALLGA